MLVAAKHIILTLFFLLLLQFCHTQDFILHAIPAIPICSSRNLPTIVNGYVDLATNLQPLIRCDQGYYLEGVAEIICRFHGNQHAWIVQGQCIRGCQGDPFFKDALVEPSVIARVGTVRKIYCIANLEQLAENSSVLCDESGRWSARGSPCPAVRLLSCNYSPIIDGSLCHYERIVETSTQSSTIVTIPQRICCSNNRTSKELIEAAKNGNLSHVLAELRSNADANSEDADGTTALMWAARQGFFGISEALLDCCALVDKQNVAGNSALMLAANSESANETLKLLIDRGQAQINLTNNARSSALILASSQGLLQNVLLLLKASADVRQIDLNQENALHWAVKGNFSDVVRALVMTRQIAIDAFNEEGDTALMIAAKQGYVSIVSILRRAGADASVLNIQSGKTALDLAVDYELNDIVDLLKMNMTEIYYDK